MKKWGLLCLGLLLLIYGLVVVVYANNTKEIGVRCIFDTQIQSIIDSHFRDFPSVKPAKDDVLIELAGKPLNNWADYLRTLASLRNLKGREVADTTNLQELNQYARQGSPLVVRDGNTLVHFRYRSHDVIKEAWSLCTDPPTAEFLPSLTWFLIKLMLLLIGAAVLWKRSKDPVAVQFFLLCICNVGAFMGGYHWFRISQDPILTIIFMTSAMLLPAVSLHFYMVFPTAKKFLERHRGLMLSLLYGPTLVLLAVMLITMTAAIAVHRLQRDPELVRDIQTLLLHEIYIALGLAAIQFAGCIVCLAHSFWFSQQGSRERQQVKWILAGASIASIPIAYTLWLAATDTEAFGLGGATWPMFLASLSITLAFGVGISRYGFLDVGQIISRSFLPLAVSLGVGLAYALIVFTGMLIMGERGIFTAPLKQATWVSVSSILMLTILDLVRNRLRTVLDRRLDRTKVMLDQTLQRMSLTVEQQLDTPTLCKRFLHAIAELVDLEEGTIYLNQANGTEYKLISHLGKEPKQKSLLVGTPLVDTLAELPMVRVHHAGGISPEPAQRQLRELGGELALPLRHENMMLAILIVGQQEGSTLDIPTLHLLTTFSQIAGLALHGAEGHAAIETLNHELQDKVQKISEQQRRIVMLQSQLSQMGASKSLPADSVIIPPSPLAKDPASVPGALPMEGIVGSSSVMRTLLTSVRKVANSQSAVLIRGESGTGKELIAKALHDGSPRAKAPFVRLHCAALAPGLLESELFGHVKGAFTGAIKDKPGRFELADKGTLFLDEIGDISLDVQTKLLRVLQEMTFERVGSSVSQTVDVRVIAATNQDLERLMKEGKFREDLFFRLNVITVRTPPLRERPEDVLELADHFLRVYSAKSNRPTLTLDDEAALALKAYHWPGNVRELENVIERSVVLAESSLVTINELPQELTQVRQSQPLSMTKPFEPSWSTSEDNWSAKFEQEERDRLIQAMSKAGGNKSKAARVLNMPRSTLISKMEKHGLLPRRT
ncbi:MAG: sigma 54-interacting transcriptional regulator [Gemmatales bacterium]